MKFDATNHLQSALDWLHSVIGCCLKKDHSQADDFEAASLDFYSEKTSEGQF